MQIDDAVVSTEDRRVVVRSSQTSTTTVGPFANEYVWFFSFDDAGEKIKEMSEFMNTAAVKDILQRRAQKNAEK